MSKNEKIYEMIRDRFIQGLELGRIPWRKTWVGIGMAPQNYISK